MHASFQEKISPEFTYPEENHLHNNSNSIDSSPVSANHSSFAAKFQDTFEQSMPEVEPFPETPTGSASSKEHFSPKCAFAPPCPTRARCERPTAIRMLPKGGKSRVRNRLFPSCLFFTAPMSFLEVIFGKKTILPKIALL